MPKVTFFCATRENEKMWGHVLRSPFIKHQYYPCSPYLTPYLIVSNRREFMRRILLILIIFGALTDVSSAAGKLSGIGNFKLGMSYASFEAWFKSKGLKIITTDKTIMTSEYDHYGISFSYQIQVQNANSFFAIEVLPAGDYGTHYTISFKNDVLNNITDIDINYLPNHQIVYLFNYVVNEIHFNKIELLFKDNSLIAIETELTEDLKDALNAKYGSAKEKITNKVVACIYSFTGVERYKQTETKTEFIWTTNKGTSANGYIHEYYDTDCNSQIFGYLLIEKNGARKIYEKRNIEYSESLSKLNEEKKREKLKEKLDEL